MIDTSFLLACLVLAMSCIAVASAVNASAVALWGRWERQFIAEGDAPAETQLGIDLVSPSGRQHAWIGFWDGGRRWRVRFMPDEEGQWRYTTRTSPAVGGLNRQSGQFTVEGAESGNPLLRHGAVRVSADGHYLEHADGTPFFWLGDTVWNGPLLAGAQDWERFLDDRAAKRFSVIQYVNHAPWRAADTDAEGRTSFSGHERIEINPEAFARIDQRIDAINRRGMVAAPVLLWSYKPEVDPGQYLPEEDAVRLIRYQIARYGAHHVVWIPLGDGKYTERVERWQRIGRESFAGLRRHPVVPHPCGMNWPYDVLGDEPWFDIAGYQSGHSDGPNYAQWIHSGPPSQGWKQQPVRPVINLEPPYEGHVAYHSKVPLDDYKVRRACWWSMLNAPPAGLTYGAQGIWSWQEQAGPPKDHPGSGVARPWHEAMAFPGSGQMKHLAEFFTSIRWWTLRPDQSLLADQPGGDDPLRFVSAARSEQGDLAVLYIPAGGQVRMKAEMLQEGVKAQWFDPRTGERIAASDDGSGLFRAPGSGDWVLALIR